MTAEPLVRSRIILTPDAFAEVVVWRLLRPQPPSTHAFKYRLASVVRGRCILRYDNERGKGDHRHGDDGETPYHFSNPEQLLEDFRADIARWNHEHGRI